MKAIPLFAIVLLMAFPLEAHALSCEAMQSLTNELRANVADQVAKPSPESEAEKARECAATKRQLEIVQTLSAAKGDAANCKFTSPVSEIKFQGDIESYTSANYQKLKKELVKSYCAGTK